MHTIRAPENDARNKNLTAQYKLMGATGGALFGGVIFRTLCHSIVHHFIEFDLRTNFCRLRFLLTDLGVDVNLIESPNKRHRMKRASSGVRCRL